MNYRDKIRKYIECPELGNYSYGEWGSLRIDQRRNIKMLLDELDMADDYIKKLYKENQKLKEMQCTFLGTGCQNKIKEYKEVIGKIRKICEFVPVSWSFCGIDVVAIIEKALKEVE